MKNMDLSRRDSLKFLFSAGAGAATLAVGASACSSSGSASASSSASAAASVSSAIGKLYEAAVAAGQTQINYYPTALGWQTVVDDFEKAFPKIKVNMETLLGPALSAKVDGEFASGKHTIDMLQVTGLTGAQLESQGRLVKWDWPAQNGVPSEYIYGGGAYFGDQVAEQLMAYNTDLVSKNEVPTSLSDLLTPQWKDKVVLERPSGGVGIDYTIANLYALGKLTSAQIKTMSGWATEPGNAQIITDLSEGKYAITPWTQGPAVEQAIVKGAPLKLAILQGASWPSISAEAILIDGPNPLAAKVLLAWLVSKAGQEAVISTGTNSIYSSLPTPTGLPSISQLPVPSIPLSEFTAWFTVTRKITAVDWPS